jgi:hypothetical protein
VKRTRAELERKIRELRDKETDTNSLTIPQKIEFADAFAALGWDDISPGVNEVDGVKYILSEESGVIEKLKHLHIYPFETCIHLVQELIAIGNGAQFVIRRTT